jgi:hypothetical protein
MSNSPLNQPNTDSTQTLRKLENISTKNQIGDINTNMLLEPPEHAEWIETPLRNSEPNSLRISMNSMDSWKL